jgi:alpha-glucosidase
VERGFQRVRPAALVSPARRGVEWLSVTLTRLCPVFHHSTPYHYSICVTCVICVTRTPPAPPVPPRTPSHSVPLSPFLSHLETLPKLHSLSSAAAPQPPSPSPSPLTHPSAVAEAYVAPDRKKHYASPDGLGQVFSFDIMLANFDVGEYRTVIDRQMQSLEGSESSTTWVLSNHDVSAARRGAAWRGPPDHEHHRVVSCGFSFVLTEPGRSSPHSLRPAQDRGVQPPRVQEGVRKVPRWRWQGSGGGSRGGPQERTGGDAHDSSAPRVDLSLPVRPL